MTHWSIRTQVVVTTPPTSDQIDQLVDALAAHGPTISTDDDVPTVSVRMDVEGTDLTDAIIAGVKAVTAALTQVGIEHIAVEAVEGQTYDSLDRAA